MRLFNFLKEVRIQAPPVIAGRLVAGLERRWSSHRLRQRDARIPTYSAGTCTQGSILNYFLLPPLEESVVPHDLLRNLTRHYTSHRFNLLGSGWVQVSYGMAAAGIEGCRFPAGPQVSVDTEGAWLDQRVNSSNLPIAQAIWRLIESPYQPIDWQLDFKSGYRWLENTWYRDIGFGPPSGRDIKMPWELARMQHLPHLALAHALATNGRPGFESPERYAREFRNQILDFLALNPPRFGVNWRCSMDVGIRVANVLVAYDWFRASGLHFDEEFEQVLKRGVFDHGRHLIENLEWYSGVRGNHYLANIVGLLFVAAYLPSNPETDAWLAFAVQELIREVEFQFYEDGSNFEASTCYHTLSAEMVYFGTALVLALPEVKCRALERYEHKFLRTRPRLNPAPIPQYTLANGVKSPFPASYFERLERMAEFTAHIIKPNNQVPQFGDNDSGRFLRLYPTYFELTVAEARKRYKNLASTHGLLDGEWHGEEDGLNHHHLIEGINALFKREDLAQVSGGRGYLGAVVSGLARGVMIPSYRKDPDKFGAEAQHVGTTETYDLLLEYLSTHPQSRQDQLFIEIPGGLKPNELCLYAYPHFGLYIVRNSRFYLAIRCGSIGQGGRGGHAHNDQLSFELNVGGEDWIADPGTYVYTALPNRRDDFRSVKAHFAPHVGDLEPDALDKGLFVLGNEANATCRYFGEQGFVGMHHGYGPPVYRVITWNTAGLSIQDFVLGELDLVPLQSQFEEFRSSSKQPGFSPGYGVLQTYRIETFHSNEVFAMDLRTSNAED